MKANTENLSLILIFIFLVTLSFLQANSQSFGYQVDQDWTMLYNSLLLTSNIEQYFISHPAYTTFFIFSICLKIIALIKPQILERIMNDKLNQKIKKIVK